MKSRNTKMVYGGASVRQLRRARVKKELARKEKLKKLFQRSASLRQVGPFDLPRDIESLFFDAVGDQEYYCECRLGSVESWADFTITGLGNKTVDGYIPNLLIQIGADGVIKGVVEQMLQKTGPCEFDVIHAVPLLPNPSDPDCELLAEKVVTQMVDDLLASSHELIDARRPSFLR